MPELVVSEIFGPTVQGEGPSTGRRAMFVRLGRCNLDCSWCDTPYTWDWTRFDADAELTRYAVGAVVEQVHQAELVVITGGEPMLQRAGLLALAEALSVEHVVEVETNGTQRPTEALIAAVSRFNVSPKLRHSGVDPERAIVPDALRDFAELAIDDGAAFKFVVASVADLSEVDDLVDVFDIPVESVWVMPEGRDPASIEIGLKSLVAETIGRGYNLSGRLHVTVWGDERGR
jgi:organic radical activating enzyme